MILSRTPFRISFFGGGTDFPAWYREFGGAVLATTIDKYCYLTCRYLPPFFEYRNRIVYSQVEHVKKIDEIQHPAVRGVLQYMNMQDGVEIHHDGDLPARSGLGSSSSFTVGLIHALRGLRGEIISKRDLANAAVYVEQEILKEHVGKQDQILTAFGGLNKIVFNQDDSYDITPIIMTKEKIAEFQNNLLLFFTGFARYGSDISKENIQNMNRRHRELMRMRSMVDEGISILQNKSSSLDEFGTLLNEYWTFKKSLSDKVTTPKIDEIYQAGMEAGALGGKLLGAGGGGFILFFVKPENHARVLERFKHLIHVTFRFDYSGSKIVMYEPNNFQ